MRASKTPTDDELRKAFEARREYNREFMKAKRATPTGREACQDNSRAYYWNNRDEILARRRERRKSSKSPPSTSGNSSSGEA